MDLDKIINELSQNERKVLQILQKLNGEAPPQTIFDTGDFTQQVEIMHAAAWLQSKKLVTIKEDITTVYLVSKEGKKYQDQGLPEKRAIQYITKQTKNVPLTQLKNVLEPPEIPIAIGWLKKNGWADIEKKDGETYLIPTAIGKKAAESETPDEHILNQLSETEAIQLDSKQIQNLLTRKNIIKEKEIISNSIILTDLGKKILDHGFEIQEEISQLTSTIIKNKEWKHKTIRPYDINAFSPAIYGGKPHPMVHLIDTIRNIFIEMGFEEIQGNYVESSFWNMDVLFIPQDHPAREMQDTLYCKHPAKLPIDDKKLLENIKNVHENGGTTGSTGWRYDFSTIEGTRTLLRTHTTINTIRYLYNNPKPPCKVFSIGRVFRKENIDPTHLPEFYQIEGIVHEKNASFRQLIGILKEFYKRMGFEKIRCRPGYFPYTEPSMDVDVFWNNKWMELGGSGIFRPEVTEPVGVKNPVLAWGLGLERLAMLKYGLTDMRRLYVSDLAWIRETPLK